MWATLWSDLDGCRNLTTSRQSEISIENVLTARPYDNEKWEMFRWTGVSQFAASFAEEDVRVTRNRRRSIPTSSLIIYCQGCEITLLLMFPRKMFNKLVICKYGERINVVFF